MRKPSKLVPRAELEAMTAERWNYSRVLTAIINGSASQPYEVAETIHDRGAAGCYYTFRFVEETLSGYGQVAVTFRCESTGQKDSTTVHNLYDMVQATQDRSGIWEFIFRTAYHRWLADRAKNIPLAA